MADSTRRAILWLSILIVVLALVAAGAGVFWRDQGTPFTFTTLRGETAHMLGSGLYRYDTVFTGSGFRGTDVLTLVVGVPVLVISLVLFVRGSLRGHLLLVGTLVYFLYVYASLALTAAYNSLFLVYLVLFSAGLFALVLTFTAVDRATLSTRLSPDVPRLGPAILLLVSGLVTMIVWLAPLLAALIEKRPPDLLASYTTKVTDALDLGTITPLCFLAGVLILRRNPLGYLWACALLVLEISLAPMIALQTWMQISAGVQFTVGQIIGPMIGFASLGAFALWAEIVIMRHIAPQRAE